MGALEAAQRVSEKRAVILGLRLNPIFAIVQTRGCLLTVHPEIY